MIEFEGKNALEELAERWALHDGTILDVNIRRDDQRGVVADLHCVPRHESPVAKTQISLFGLFSFDFSWDEDSDFFFVPGYKALITASGSVYLSLDPYDDRDVVPDDRDSSVFESKEIVVSFEMK